MSRRELRGGRTRGEELGGKGKERETRGQLSESEEEMSESEQSPRRSLRRGESPINSFKGSSRKPSAIKILASKEDRKKEVEDAINSKVKELVYFSENFSRIASLIQNVIETDKRLKSDQPKGHFVTIPTFTSGTKGSTGHDIIPITDLLPAQYKNLDISVGTSTLKQLSAFLGSEISNLKPFIENMKKATRGRNYKGLNALQIANDELSTYFHNPDNFPKFFNPGSISITANKRSEIVVEYFGGKTNKDSLVYYFIGNLGFRGKQIEGEVITVGKVTVLARMLSLSFRYLGAMTDKGLYRVTDVIYEQLSTALKKVYRNLAEAKKENKKGIAMHPLVGTNEPFDYRYLNNIIRESLLRDKNDKLVNATAKIVSARLRSFNSNSMTQDLIRKINYDDIDPHWTENDTDVNGVEGDVKTVAVFDDIYSRIWNEQFKAQTS